MKNNQKHIVFSNITLIIALMFSLLFTFMIGISPNISHAEENTYTNVLTDLQKDKNFNKVDYPALTNDYSLQVVQIAESTESELFIYVYQPSATKDLRATSINISTGIDEQLSFDNYQLIYINSNSTLYKYKVENFKVKNILIRYYEISSIFRAWDSSIDEALDKTNENTIDEVSYKVAKAYSFTGNGQDLTMYCQDVETIEITSKYVGFVRYSGGHHPLWDSSGDLDAHFIAFSTDKEIEHLMEADVYYTSQVAYNRHYAGGIPSDVNTFKAKTPLNVTLKYDQKVEYTGSGFWANTYKWDRIQTIDEFKATETNREYIHSCGIFDVYSNSTLTDEGLEDLESKQWVLRFAETYYDSYKNNGVTHTNYTIVGEVSILRLKFETDGVTYNLGVIDNKQTGSLTPDNETTTKITAPAWLQSIINFFKSLPRAIKIILLVIFSILLVVAVCYIIKFFYNLISKLLK